jgi:hypothetical protein
MTLDEILDMPVSKIIPPLSAEEMKAASVPGRECGQCTLCCKLLEVSEIEKPQGKWCKHCTPGKGCNIYDDRPDLCKVWYCGWRMWERLGPEWYPRRSKIVIDPGGLSQHPESKVEVYVDPGYPNQWRKPEYLMELRRLARRGLEGTPPYRLILWVGGKGKYILPDKEVEIELGTHDVIVPTGDGPDGIVWDVISFPDAESGERVLKFVNAVSQKAADKQRETGLRDVTPYFEEILSEVVKGL